jgi:hypothetical protein
MELAGIIASKAAAFTRLCLAIENFIYDLTSDGSIDSIQNLLGNVKDENTYNKAHLNKLSRYYKIHKDRRPSTLASGDWQDVYSFDGLAAHWILAASIPIADRPVDERSTSECYHVV